MIVLAEDTFSFERKSGTVQKDNSVRMIHRHNIDTILRRNICHVVSMLQGILRRFSSYQGIIIQIQKDKSV